MASLSLSVCRVAALFVVDRLKSEVVAAAVTHYQALALHKTRRRALKRLAGKYNADCPTNKVSHLFSVSTTHRLHRHGCALGWHEPRCSRCVFHACCCESDQCVAKACNAVQFHFRTLPLKHLSLDLVTTQAG